MYYRLLGFILTIATITSFAAEITVYRWVDENNVVHFSQHQPEHDNYTEVTMVEAMRSKSTLTNPASTQQASTEDESQVTKPFEESDINNERCIAAKQNIETLNSFKVIQYTNAQGETKILTDQQKKDQLALSNKQVEIYCK